MSLLFEVKPVEQALDALLAYKFPAVDLSPVIRCSSAALRSSRAGAFRAMLRDLDATRASVAALEDKIEKLAFGLRHRRAAVVATLAPVSGLPTELLVEIFDIVSTDDRTSKARITLSHVSSLWRAVALGAKELWTNIQVPSRTPEMVHEFARRSGSLPLELSTRSRFGWPEDLELTSDEASRLSVLCSHSSPPPKFSASLTRYASLMGLDVLIIAAGGAAHDISGGMCHARDVKLDDAKLSGWPTMEFLESLTICNSSAGNANAHMTRINAPRLSQLKLSGIRDENNNNRPWNNLHLDIGRYQDQLTTLTLSKSDNDVHSTVLNQWRMPNLVSFTHHSTDSNGSPIETDVWCLLTLFIESPALKHLSLAFPSPRFSCLFGDARMPFLLPRLETLSLGYTSKSSHPESVIEPTREALISALSIRVNSPDIQRLQHLTISSSFMSDPVTEQQQYGEYVDNVTVDYS